MISTGTDLFVEILSIVFQRDFFNFSFFKVVYQTVLTADL